MEIVRSKILSQFPEIIFGMSTRLGGVSEGKLGLNMSFRVGDTPENVLENRKRFLTYLNIPSENVAFPQQEHTTNVQICSVAAKFDNCDALVSQEPNIFLAISIADCTPVVLYDPVTKTVAAIHAGWRGTAGKIVEKTIHTMQNNFSVNPKNIFAFIGPSAGGCCYEVGTEVAKQFSEECKTLKDNGKFLLDVKKANYLQLLSMEVSEQQIEVHPDCTIMNEKYHSYRRDGKESGRMLAVIGFKN